MHEPRDPAQGRVVSASILGWITVVYAVLTLLVVGLFALQRGLWQDDASLLKVAQWRLENRRLFRPVVSPTRRMFLVFYALAVVSPRPVEVMQAMCVFAWAAQGVLSFAIALRIDRRWMNAYLAGALTLCASSDYLTASAVSLSYGICAVEYWSAFWCALTYIEEGRRIWAVAAAALLSMSVWSTDAPLPLALLAPAAFWLATRGAPRRTAIPLVSLWVGTLVLYLWVLASAATDPASYLRRAQQVTSGPQLITATWSLFALNFQPWLWPLARPVGWSATGEHVLSQSFIIAGACAGLCVFWLGIWKLAAKEPTEAGPGEDIGWRWVGFFVVGALLCNAAFSAVQFSSLHYRTHLFSRVCASLALGLTFGRLWRAGRIGRRLAGAAASLFVGFGVWGGLERQDFFLAAWRVHQRELSSIVEEAPSFMAGTNLVLELPSTHPYLATSVPYLARSWGTLLYPDRESAPAVLLWLPDGRSSCRVEIDGWHCKADPQDIGEDDRILPYAATVVMTFDSGDGRYHLVRRLPIRLGGGHPFVDAAYAPDERIVRGRITARQRALLLLP